MKAVWKSGVIQSHDGFSEPEMKGTIYVYFTDYRFHPDCLALSFKSKQISIIVWGCFAGSTLGELIVYPKGGIGAVEYINTLQ